MGTKKVRILENVGHPSSGVTIRQGATVDLPEYWADKYVNQGVAEFIIEDEGPKEVKNGKRNKDDQGPAADPV